MENVRPLDADNARAAARLMGTLKPEWWSESAAYRQLTDITEAIGTVGWVITERGDVKGFALFRELKGYRTLELECCGYDDHGAFKLEHKLSGIFDAAEEHARALGFAALRVGMSSVGFNIHGRPPGPIGAEIEGLASNREDFDRLINRGFIVVGVQPDVYAQGSHLITLAKRI